MILATLYLFSFSFFLFPYLVIFVAGFIAGMINTVAGGGTLVSFPALVWIGCDPINASATNTVALWPGSLAGMIGFRRELGGSRRWMILLGAPSVVGAFVGAFLLLKTPSPVFASIVPYLILFATVLFAASGRLGRPTQADVSSSQKSDRAWWIGVATFQFFIAVYGGYFGAGIGILMLSALSLLGLTDIHHMNGLKNFFALLINVIAAVYFTWRGAVIWDYAFVMTAGAIAGGYGGAGLARRLGRPLVRWLVVAIGLAVAISLLFRR